MTMDVPLHWTLEYLRARATDLIPSDSDLAAALHAVFLSPSSPLQALFRAAEAFFATQMLPLLNLLLDRLVALLAASPNVVAAAAVLVLAVAVLQVLSLVRRVLVFWTRLAFRLLFWAAVVLAASVVWERGVERTARDAAVLGGHVAAWLAGVAQVWWREYERAQQQLQAQAPAPGQGQGPQGGGWYQQPNKGGVR